MSNLIITIVSIALVAIAAIMGIYYGGIAYENAQINAIANSIMTEAQQILAAERLWSVNNNQLDISGMPNPNVVNGATFLNNTWVGGTGISALVNSKTLAEWPPLGGSLGGPTYILPAAFPGAGPSQTGANLSIAGQDGGCYYFNGYTGQMGRTIFAYNNGNYVLYNWSINYPAAAGSCQTIAGNFSASTTDVSQINHPIVQIAKAINNSLNQIASNALTTKMPYIGLPMPPVGATNAYAKVFFDSNGVIQTNYCYLATTNTIACVFGPS